MGWCVTTPKTKKTKNSKNKSCKLGDKSTKNCGLNPKFENCIFKDNPNEQPLHVHVHQFQSGGWIVWCSKGRGVAQGESWKVKKRALFHHCSNYLYLPVPCLINSGTLIPCSRFCWYVKIKTTFARLWQGRSASNALVRMVDFGWGCTLPIDRCLRNKKTCMHFNICIHDWWQA